MLVLSGFLVVRNGDERMPVPDAPAVHDPHPNRRQLLLLYSYRPLVTPCGRQVEMAIRLEQTIN